MKALLTLWRAWLTEQWRGIWRAPANVKALALSWWKWLVGHARGTWNAPAPAWALPPRPRELSVEQLRSLEAQVRRGNEARSLWDNPLFVEAAHKVHEHLAAQRRQASIADQTMHTRLVLAEQMLARVLGGIQEVMVTGQLANQQILRTESTSERIRQAFRRGIRA